MTVRRRDRAGRVRAGNPAGSRWPGRAGHSQVPWRPMKVPCRSGGTRPDPPRCRATEAQPGEACFRSRAVRRSVPWPTPDDRHRERSPWRSELAEERRGHQQAEAGDHQPERMRSEHRHVTELRGDAAAAQQQGDQPDTEGGRSEFHREVS